MNHSDNNQIHRSYQQILKQIEQCNEEVNDLVKYLETNGVLNWIMNDLSFSELTVIAKEVPYGCMSLLLGITPKAYVESKDRINFEQSNPELFCKFSAISKPILCKMYTLGARIDEYNQIIPILEQISLTNAFSSIDTSHLQLNNSTTSVH